MIGVLFVFTLKVEGGFIELMQRKTRERLLIGHHVMM